MSNEIVMIVIVAAIGIGSICGVMYAINVFGERLVEAVNITIEHDIESLHEGRKRAEDESCNRDCNKRRSDSQHAQEQYERFIYGAWLTIKKEREIAKDIKICEESKEMVEPLEDEPCACEGDEHGNNCSECQEQEATDEQQRVEAEEEVEDTYPIFPVRIARMQAIQHYTYSFGCDLTLRYWGYCNAGSNQYYLRHKNKLYSFHLNSNFSYFLPIYNGLHGWKLKCGITEDCDAGEKTPVSVRELSPDELSELLLLEHSKDTDECNENKVRSVITSKPGTQATNHRTAAEKIAEANKKAANPADKAVEAIKKTLEHNFGDKTKGE